MRIIDILHEDRPSLSFEVFPPKKETAFDSIRLSTEQIASLKPSFVSVTYGAGGGGARHYTLDIAKDLMETEGVSTLAHLTCVGSSKEDVTAYLQKMKEMGMENVMALRGDLPPGEEAGSVREFQHASDLITYIREHGNFCIGGACYPEGHPESANMRGDVAALKKKVDAGADFLTTQMVFDNSLLFQYLYTLREADIRVPVVPGIMPITKARQLQRAIELSGSFVPRRFTQLVDRFGSDDAAMRQAGIAYATDQIMDLYANGITHVHLYTMNDYTVASAIQGNLSAILKK